MGVGWADGRIIGEGGGWQEREREREMRCGYGGGVLDDGIPIVEEPKRARGARVGISIKQSTAADRAKQRTTGTSISARFRRFD